MSYVSNSMHKEKWSTVEQIKGTDSKVLIKTNVSTCQTHTSCTGVLGLWSEQNHWYLKCSTMKLSKY